MERSMHDIRFPGESESYREARDRLLQAEIALRRQIEEVAAMRRSLPPGGLVKEDYVFEDNSPSGRVKLSELFRGDMDTLVIYSFMYGPRAEKPCPSCSSILDSLDGVIPHALQRINVAVVAKSPLDRVMAFARDRGWKRLPLLSSAHNSYNADYRGETAEGAQRPALNVFRRYPDGIRHTYCTELMFVPAEPAQDPRHADAIWPLWSLFDYTPQGRGDWRPALSYGQA